MTDSKMRDQEPFPFRGPGLFPSLRTKSVCPDAIAGIQGVSN